MMDHGSIQFSSLKAIKVPLLIDRSAEFVERPLGRSPRRRPPLESGSESERLVWVALPKGSLYPKYKDLAAPCIPIPTRLAYKPNRRPPPQIGTNPSANQPATVTGDISSKGRKVIVSRQLLVNGNITFIVGTTFSGIVNRDPKEVPLLQILNHVPQAELQRFENQDFLEEDIREASRPPLKSKGRPVGSKLIDGRLVLAGARAGSSVAQKPQAQPRRPVVLLPGSSQQGSASAPSSRTSHLAIKVPAFNAYPQVSVRVPSFNGPQPGKSKHVSDIDALSESSEVELSGQKPTRRPQYAMITASGLAPSETSVEEETLREFSTSRAPSHEASLSYDREQSPKRRRLDSHLPLRATRPTSTMQLNGGDTISNMYSGERTFFGKLFQQSAPSASMTEADRTVYKSLNDHANSLPPTWPPSAPIAVAAPDDPFQPSKSSFLPGFDRGRYPAGRRRRGNKYYTPKRTTASVSGTLSKPSVPATQIPQDSTAQSELDDVELIDMVETRDEGAEREALLRQFKPINIQQSRQPSSSPKVPKSVTATPPHRTAPEPASHPILAQKASLLARDILSKVNGQSQLAKPSPTPSIQVTTSGKSIQKRASLTPHFPRGVKFASDTLRSLSNHQPHKSNSDHSPSKTIIPPPSKTMQSAIKRKKSPESSTWTKARPTKSHSNGLSPSISKTTAPSSFSPRSDTTNLTVPIKNQFSNHIKFSPPTNGTSGKHKLQSPTPANDITAYFRPKSNPVKTLPPPSSEDDEIESEDPLTRASSYDSLSPRVPGLQRRSMREYSNPAPAQAESDSESDSMNSDVLLVQRNTPNPDLDDSDSNSNSDNMNPDVRRVQRRSQHNTPIRVPDRGSLDEADDVEVPDSEDELHEVSDSNHEVTMHGSEHFSGQSQPAGPMPVSGRSVEVDEDEDESERERVVVEVSSGSETDG